MGISIAVETEDGEALERADDPGNVLNRILPPPGTPDYHCLTYIDPYGDTTFNRYQVPRFLEEWKRLEPTIKTPEEQAVFAKVEQFAQRSLAEPHLYLKFYGD